MRRLEHKMAAAIDIGCFFVGISAPKHEYNGFRLVVHGRHNSIRELLPPLFAVCGGFVHFDGQHAVEQQDALFGPTLQKAMRWPRYAQVAFQLFVNVQQACLTTLLI